jgi:mono/diheme cytochrome c family protein
MNPRCLVLLLLPICSVAFGQQAPPATNSTASSSSPRTRGGQAFTESGCPQCHTIRHQGGTKGPDLSEVGRRLNEEQIRTQILKGGKQMPSFGGVLEGTEIEDLVAYLRTLREDDKSEKRQ